MHPPLSSTPTSTGPTERIHTATLPSLLHLNSDRDTEGATGTHIRLPEILRLEEIHTVPEPLDEVIVFIVEGSPVWVHVVVAPPIVQHWPVGLTEPKLEELDWIGDVGVIG
jgi:hypothetical protein